MPPPLHQFPTALLEQFPALATMTWGAADGDYDDGDGAFDPSGNEYDDDLSDVSGGSALNSHRNSYDGSNAVKWEEGSWFSDTGDGGNYQQQQQQV